jgi:hypothetical protein
MLQTDRLIPQPHEVDDAAALHAFWSDRETLQFWQSVPTALGQRIQSVTPVEQRCIDD